MDDKHRLMECNTRKHGALVYKHFNAPRGKNHFKLY